MVCLFSHFFIPDGTAFAVVGVVGYVRLKWPFSLSLPPWLANSSCTTNGKAGANTKKIRRSGRIILLVGLFAIAVLVFVVLVMIINIMIVIVAVLPCIVATSCVVLVVVVVVIRMMTGRWLVGTGSRHDNSYE